MTIALSAVGVLLAALAILLIHFARRLDRLHTALMKSRRALEHALSARATAAHDFAASAGLDPASSLLLAEAADTCLRQGMKPIASDGLDAAVHSRGAAGAATALKPDLAQERRLAGERVAAESALTRTLRLTADELAEIEGLDPTGTLPVQSDTTGFDVHSEEQMALFSALQRSRLDVKMTRSFHNSHVDQIRRLRRNPLVRIFHLAGGAPVPQTVDLDDE